MGVANDDPGNPVQVVACGKTVVTQCTKEAVSHNIDRSYTVYRRYRHNMDTDKPSSLGR